MEELKREISALSRHLADAILWKVFFGVVLSFITVFSLVSLEWQIGLFAANLVGGTEFYIGFLSLLFLSGLLGLSLLFQNRKLPASPPSLPSEDINLIQIGLIGISSGFVQGYRSRRSKPSRTPGEGYLAEDHGPSVVNLF